MYNLVFVKNIWAWWIRRSTKCGSRSAESGYGVKNSCLKTILLLDYVFPTLMGLIINNFARLLLNSVFFTLWGHKVETTESSFQNSQKITKIVLNKSNKKVIHSFLCETLMDLMINNLRLIIFRLRLFHFMGA